MIPTIALIILLLTNGAYGAETRFDIPVADSPSLGPANAPVTIIEFIDFQ
jgi:hypothetical protein